MKIAALLFLFVCKTAFAQFDVPLTRYQQFNGKFDYVIIGNSHSQFDNYATPQPPCDMLTQSSAILNLLPNQNIVGAYLTWYGIGDGKFALNPTLNGNIVNPDLTFLTNIGDSNSPIFFFTKTKNISTTVQLTGNGTYNFSNFDLNLLTGPYCFQGIHYSGWYIVIVYENNALPIKQLNIYNGFRYVGNSTFISTNLLIPNLNVVETQNAKMTYVAFNGSPNVFIVESIKFNNNILSNALNPPNNPFNGTNSFTGSTTSWNQDIDTFDVSPYVNLGDKEAKITMSSGVLRFISTVVTSIRSELPDATVQLNTVSGQNVCNNRSLQVNYTVQNTNSNGNLPANIPVSFYANNTLLQTVNTPSIIAIGATLPLQTTVSIPLSVANTFNLRVVVDNAVAVSSTIAESNENNNEASQSVTLLEGALIPAFSLANTFCQGAIVPVLPSVSANGVSGVWSPAVISNVSGGTYTFTSTGSCNVSFKLDIDIIAPQSVKENLSICSGVNNTVVNAALLETNLSTTNYSFTWLKDNVLLTDVSSSLSVLSPGVYLATANEIATGCKQDFVFNVDAPTPITANVVVPPDFSQNQIIAVAASGGTGNYSYSFDGFPFQPNASYAVTNIGQVSVVVKDDTNCAPFSKTIVLWQYPNFFTPNGDGYNDSWQIVTGKKIEVSIFNRYGELLTQLRANEGWNGTFNGQNVPADDYWFVINYENVVFKGHFSLKR